MVVVRLKEITIAPPKKFKNILSNNISRSLIVQVIYFILGLLSSRGAILGEYSPFGNAFIAAVPYNCLLSSLVGEIIGYIIPSSIGSSMRYIASIIAVVAIRWTLSDLKKLTLHPLFAPVVAFVPSIATGLAVASVDDFKTSVVMLIVFESFLSATGAYFFSKTIKFSRGKHGINGFNQEEFACLSMTICITILSFSNMYINGISLGRILAVLIILLCARYAGVSGGSISGIAAGIVFSISSSSLSYVSGSYAFAGMMAGLFSPIGSFVTAFAFIVSNVIVTFETGDSAKIILSVYETVAAAIIFMLVPRNISDKFTLLFSKQSNAIKIDSLRNSITMRLDYVSKAMGEVAESVSSVSKKLSKINVQNIDEVCVNAINYTCRGCGLKVFCWEKEHDHTTEAFANISNVLESNGRVEITDFPKTFAHRCSKYPEIIRSINKYYDEFVIKESAQKRMGEIRGIISEQFMGMSRILKDIETEFKEYEKFNDSMAEKLMSRLKQIDIIPLDISCRENKFGRLSIEIEIMNYQRKQLDNVIIGKEISDVCGRVMDIPQVSYADDRCRIQVSEKPELDIEIGSAQHICNYGKLCGDSFSYFDDGMGRKVIVISDGMGTGGRAAVDGAMTTGIISQLSKAGLGFNASLKIVNSALLAKSGEESLATLDITCVDMFSGKTEFLKAGASSTYVRKKNRVIKVTSPSLPVGILTNVEFSTSDMVLNEGDWILMVSDGAIANGDKWIESEFIEYNGDSTEDFANHIVDMAVKNKFNDYDDDITAVAIKVVAGDMK